MQKIEVILGCFGRVDDGFISCNSSENVILTIDLSHNEIMDYFDQMQLFDKSLLNYNAVRHLIFNIQEKFGYLDKNLWSEKMFLIYQKFLISHSCCGIFVKLRTSE